MKEEMNNVIGTLKANKLFFVLSWFFIFLISFGILSFIGLVPDFEDRVEQPQVMEQDFDSLEPAVPIKIVISKIGVDMKINNPESRNINVLDQSLNSGVVRYPNSGLLGERTNMLLFGHSSYLPIVRNKAYKAFNKLEDLEIGDRISVFSEDTEFIYQVSSVEEADATNALISFETNRRMITLSTCNTFGNLNDRFIIQAELIGIRII